MGIIDMSDTDYVVYNEVYDEFDFCATIQSAIDAAEDKVKKVVLDGHDDCNILIYKLNSIVRAEIKVNTHREIMEKDK